MLDMETPRNAWAFQSDFSWLGRAAKSNQPTPGTARAERRGSGTLNAPQQDRFPA
jgi:hypothetical protein